MSEKAEVALKSGRLLTPRGDSVCQNTLTLGKMYVLFGKVKHLKAYTNMCDATYRWEDLSRRQRKGLKMMYRQGCVCQIASCYSSLYCQKRKGACLFSTLKRSCYDSEVNLLIAFINNVSQMLDEFCADSMHDNKTIDNGFKT